MTDFPPVEETCPPARLFNCPRIDREIIGQDAESASVHNITSAMDFFRKLPAADLHVHGGALADIALSTEIAWERSSKIDGRLKQLFQSRQELRNRLAHPHPGNLHDYFFLYHNVRNYLFTNLSDIKTVAREGALHAHRNGTCLLEVRTSIKSGQLGDPLSRHIMREVNFTPSEEFSAMIEGFEEATRQAEGNLHVYVIITFRRGDSVENTLEILGEAIRIRENIRQKFGKDYIRGIDIAGAEYGDANKGKRFKEVFSLARQNGFNLTAHAGEEAGVGEGAILHAIDHLGVDRIGHGTALHMPTPLLDPAITHQKNGITKNAFVRLLQRGVPLEMCLTSNLIAGAQRTIGYKANPGNKPTPILQNLASPSDYPFEILTALGDIVPSNKRPVLPLICTDGVFSLNTNLAREYSQAASVFDFGIAETLAFAYYSLAHSFAPEKIKSEIIRKKWLPFTRAFLKSTDPITEMESCLKTYRKRLRNKLGLDDDMVRRITEEVIQ